MKTLIAFLVTVISLFLSPVLGNRPGFARPDELPCAFTVADTDAPAKLTVNDAKCNGAHWTATLVLTNTGDKIITGYDISNVEAYEYKRNVKSSQGQTGFKLEPGKSKNISANGGFRNGLSYGKPTGAVQTNRFRITRLEFADGTIWRVKRTR